MDIYGKKIIQRIFKQWARSHTICYEFESKVQADSDRSNIRMFEIGLSTQRYGNNKQSTRNAEKEESQRLIDIAKKHDLFIPKSNWDKFGNQKRNPSGESIVFLNKELTLVYKIKNPFAKAAIKQMNPREAIYEHIIHNMLFPKTKYNFIGISEDVDGVRIVLSQPYISRQYTSVRQKDIDKYLTEKLALKPQNRYFYGNQWISITDVSENSDNVLENEYGELFFIDPIIKFNKPAVEVLEYYYNLISRNTTDELK